MSATPAIQAVIVPVTPFQQNCSVLWCSETMKGAVVDPGGDLDRILAAAAERHVEIEKILVTHGHIDHSGNAAELAAQLDVPIEGPHPDDSFWIDMMTEQGEQWGVAGARPFQPTRWLDQGDSVSFGKVTLAVLHCPGHTPGHVVFHHAEAKLAIVGDVLFQGSIGRTDFPRGNHAALIHSITTRLWPLGGDTAFVPGHGQMSNFAAERQSNPFVSDAVLEASAP
ncbi:MAG: MBL fold metallo-hydrolase [Proteobacteria bacterium]|nr:MBL fold metallo-hydrolase [Pseudomonadota bacterium]MDA1356995.1 MBL fold metallo-hydrolase [Pseudomonadota bacterium]